MIKYPGRKPTKLEQLTLRASIFTFYRVNVIVHHIFEDNDKLRLQVEEKRGGQILFYRMEL